MTLHVVKVPDIGEGIAEVEVVAWHVKPGDTVAEDQALADVMTDKASVEIPSPIAGTVVALGGEVGQMLAVGGELLRIEPAGESARTRSEASAAQPSATAAATAAPAGPQALATAPAMASTGPRSVGPARTACADAGAAPIAPQRPIASPAVRARAWELGIDLRDLAASGPAGRIVQADLDAHLARGGRRTLPAAPAAHAAHAVPTTPGATHEVRIVGLRRRIAQKMQEAKRRIPHYSYVEEVDVTELEALRARLNAKWGAQRGALTLLPFIVRATTLAVREFPQVNGRFDDEAGVLTLHEPVHLGIATQTDAGLMVPVLRDAQALDLWAAAAGIARLAEAARSGKAVRDELSGSTITITSLGKLGGVMSTPVINHPEVAIVGVNRAVLRPMIRDGAVAARLMMNLSSSFDHRVVDGAVGAAFIQCLRGYLESPATAFMP